MKFNLSRIDIRSIWTLEYQKGSIVILYMLLLASFVTYNNIFVVDFNRCQNVVSIWSFVIIKNMDAKTITGCHQINYQSDEGSWLRKSTVVLLNGFVFMSSKQYTFN